MENGNWPRRGCANKADFRGHTSLEGASSFLIQTAEGRILAATALHLLGENGGAEPPVTIWFEPEKEGEKYREAGGEDAAAIKEWIQPKP